MRSFFDTGLTIYIKMGVTELDNFCDGICHRAAPKPKTGYTFKEETK